MFHTKTKKTVIIAEILIVVNNYVRIHYLSVLVHLFCNKSNKLLSKKLEREIIDFLVI